MARCFVAHSCLPWWSFSTKWIRTSNIVRLLIASDVKWKRTRSHPLRTKLGIFSHRSWSSIKRMFIFVSFGLSLTIRSMRGKDVDFDTFQVGQWSTRTSYEKLWLISSFNHYPLLFIFIQVYSSVSFTQIADTKTFIHQSLSMERTCVHTRVLTDKFTVHIPKNWIASSTYTDMIDCD
jgi:hypothetical protein